MAYEGYHLKFNGVIYPEKYCCNYKCTPDRRTDKGSSVKSTGKLKRKILPHKRSGITFNTGFVTDNDLDALRYIFSGRDNVTVTYWNPATTGYGTGECYLPDIEFEVLLCEDGINNYRPVEMEIIEY